MKVKELVNTFLHEESEEINSKSSLKRPGVRIFK